MLGVVSLAGGCKEAMSVSPQIPAAQAWYDADEDDNGNVELEVSVEHLAPPRDVAPGANTYVVWVTPVGERPRNVGALQVEDDRDGVLHTLTPHQEFELSVTAEPAENAQFPSSRPLLWAQVDLDD